MHKFAPGQIEFLRNHVVGRSKRELTEAFNKTFKLELKESQIISCCKNHKLPTSGFNGRFRPGHVPFNKGMKGVSFGGKGTQFQKGQTPLNYRTVGSERVSVDGYVEIKVSDPNKWRLKHIIIWEEVHGPVPKGHCLIFLDGDKLNINLENMQLITRKQLVRLNQNHLISDNPELTKTGIIIADIYSKIGEHRRKGKKAGLKHGL